MSRCRNCGWWNHPPAPVCRRCLSRDIHSEALSGRATVQAFTINRHQWSPEASTDAYVIAIREFPEQEGLRLTTNIIHCPPEAVAIGMPVKVVFEPVADVALPSSNPTAEGARSSTRRGRTRHPLCTFSRSRSEW